MKSNFVKHAVLVAMLVTFCNTSYSADFINKQCGFQLTLPDQFFEIEVDRRESGNEAVLARYIDREDASPESPAFVIQIIRLEFMIDASVRSKPEQAKMIDGVRPELGVLDWRGLKLETLRMTHIPGMVIYTIGFPFQDPGLALQVIGPTEKESEVIQLFDQAAQGYYNLNPIKPLTRPEAHQQASQDVQNRGGIRAAIMLFAMVGGIALTAIKRVFLS